MATHLDRDKFDLDFILLTRGDTALEKFLTTERIPVKRMYLYRGWKMIFTLIPLWWRLMRSRPDIIHTHLRYATILGILAGKMAGINRRIYTRHHSTSNHYYYPHGVKTDRWISRMSTQVVSISDVVTQTLTQREGLPLKKITKIPHGFDLLDFANPGSERVESVREKYLPERKRPVIGMISRYLELKGHKYVIEAFRKLLMDQPGAHLVLANASGSYRDEVFEALATLPQDSYTEIVFEHDIAALYHLFDVFVHVPIADHIEAFGQTYVEALAAGVPSVFTISGIAGEFIVHEHNALVVDYKDPEGICESIQRILDGPDLRKKLIENGRKDVQRFSLDTFINRLENLYFNG